MPGKKRSGGGRLGKLVERTRPEAERTSKGKKPAGQFGQRSPPKSASKSRSLSDEERMLRAILANRD